MPLNRFLAYFALAAATSACQFHSADRTTQTIPPGPFSDVVKAVSDTMHRWHYDPAELESEDYEAMVTQMTAVASTASSPKDFASRFNTTWREHGPFSHVRIDVAQASAAETATHLDGMKVGGTGASLTWQGDVAILTVNTMMGTDTIEQIHSAFDEIVATPAKGLIVDLRNNKGGTFAGASLIAHVIDQPFDAGAFVSQSWARENTRAPGAADLEGIAPWTGWSIQDFWRDVQADQLTRIQFQPVAPHYAGAICVLTSADTASAAEMTADAFRTSGRATLIGETTAGQMLSQKMYDMPQGLMLSLPIADYYSVTAGRIEGVGVVPDVAAPRTAAMEIALQRVAAR